MMSAAVTFERGMVRIGRPQTLFEGDYLSWGTGNYDVSADGMRFIMVRPAAANVRTLSLRLHWPVELARLVPIQP